MEFARLVASNVCEQKRLQEFEIDVFRVYFLSSEVCKDFILTFVDSTQLLKDLHYC